LLHQGSNRPTKAEPKTANGRYRGEVRRVRNLFEMGTEWGSNPPRSTNKNKNEVNKNETLNAFYRS
jgi:hypothetical protein